MPATRRYWLGCAAQKRSASDSFISPATVLNWLPASALRLLRKSLLGYIRRLTPDQMLDRSRQGAIRAVTRAAQSSPAYRVLLAEHSLDPSREFSAVDLAKLPVLTKNNTFERFHLDDLTGGVPAADLGDVLTSSGRGGSGFGFRLTSRKQHASAWFDIDLGLQDAFDVDRRPTLLVNCLPMGVVFNSRAVTVANVSVRQDMACSILKDVGPHFEQTILCTDPLFVRQILDHAELVGIDWKALKTSVILGEEVLVEAQRDYIAAKMGIDVDRDPLRMIGSSFGVGELGLNLLFETRETIALRRAMRSRPEVRTLLVGEHGGLAAPSIFCFNPLRTHIEVLNPDADGYGELCFTMLDPNAVIPLPRYTTGDTGKLVSTHATTEAASLCGTPAPWLPVVTLRGRIKDRCPGMPSVEDIKELIYLDHGIADRLTGAFLLTPEGSGRAKVSLLARNEQSTTEAELNAGLGRLVKHLDLKNLTIEVLAAEAFPHRPTIDHERKFPYLRAAGH